MYEEIFCHKIALWGGGDGGGGPFLLVLSETTTPEPVLLNVYGAPELIPRNEFRQTM